MKSGTLTVIGVIMLLLCLIGSILIGKNFESFWIGIIAFVMSFISLLPWFAIDKILEHVEEISSNTHPKSNTSSNKQTKKQKAAYFFCNNKDDKKHILHTICPQCNYENEENSLYCKSCGFDLSHDIPEEIKPKDRIKSSMGNFYSVLRYTIKLVIIVAIISFPFIAFTTCSNKLMNNTSAPTSTVELSMGDGGSIMCAINEKYYDEFITYSANSNIDEINKMLDLGVIFRVPDKTAVEVKKQAGTGKTEVKIIDGSHNGETVIVAADAIYS